MFIVSKIGKKHDFDNEKMPIQFENPMRVNVSMYPAWGLKTGMYRRENNRRYLEEWTGDEDQMKNVAAAAQESGLGNYSVSLHNFGGKIVAYLVSEAEGNVDVLDVGSGPGTSIRTVYSMLPKDMWDKMHVTLIDPSKDSIEDAKRFLKNELGLFEGKHFDAVVGTDLDIPKKLDKGKYHVAYQNSAIHHHAYLDEAFQAVTYALKNGDFKIKNVDDGKGGGVFFSVDWHSRLWESPSMVYQWLLKRMEWPKKDEGLKYFLERYTDADKPLPAMGLLDEKNLENFSAYWGAWSKRRNRLIEEGKLRPGSDFYGVEGHCPVEIYESEMINAGLELDTPLIRRLVDTGMMDENPHQIFPDHNLNMGLIGQKYEQ